MKLGFRRSFLYRIVRLFAIAYATVILVLAGCQSRYIYYPERVETEELSRLAEEIGAIAWKNRAGERVGWKFPRAAESDTGAFAVLFHGNAGMAIRRDYFAEGLQERAGGEGWKLYVFEYPGYGDRAGNPGEERFYEAAREGIQELLDAEEGSLLLIGESLGSGVASQMAAEYKDHIAGLLLITPFTNLADVAARHFRGVPVRLLLRHRYDNVDALQNYHGPLAVVLAERDEVVPADLGKQLFDGYAGPKKLWIQEGQNHNTLDLSPRAEWWGEMEMFFEENRSP